MMTVMFKSVEESDHSLQEIEREALSLETEKLSKEARSKLARMRARVHELRKAMKRLQALAPFSPQIAGEVVAAKLQAAEGGALSGAEMKQAFDLTPAVLYRRRRERRIVYWRDARHNFFYPRWQFTPSGALIPGVQDVLQIFKSDDEWRIMRYFLGSRKQLGNRRPLDLLRAGQADKVMAHVRDHVAENTW
jgi:hypothetical protein